MSKDEDNINYSHSVSAQGPRLMRTAGVHPFSPLCNMSLCGNTVDHGFNIYKMMNLMFSETPSRYETVGPSELS